MTIKQFGIFKLLLIIFFSCADVTASSINISAIKDIDVTGNGNKNGFLQTDTNLTWLDIGVVPNSFLKNMARGGQIDSNNSTFSGWRIATESEVVSLLMSIFPGSGLGYIGGSWGGTTTEVDDFNRVASIFGVHEASSAIGSLSDGDFQYAGWRASASFIGEDGLNKVFYLGRQGSDGFLPSVEILGFDQSALDRYIETFSVTPLFVAVSEPSSGLLFIFGFAFLVIKKLLRSRGRKEFF